MVSKEEVIVSFFILQAIHRLCECGALQSLNTADNAMTSNENANTDNARNDNVEQICNCLLFIMNIIVSHKIVVTVLMMQDGLKTAQSFLSKEKESHTNSVTQLYFIYSFTLTHHLFFCFILFVYYKGRQKMASLIQVI